MNTSAKLILFPQPTKKGYPLKVRIIQDRKPVYIGLKFYLTDSQKQKYWNESKVELRKSYPFYAEVMIEFNKEMNNIGIETIDNKASIEQEPVMNNDSFTSFYNNYIKSLYNKNQLGLLQKVNSVLLQLNSYCKSIDKSSDVLFKDLNIDFMNGFQIYLIEQNLLPVTQRGYIEKIRSIVNLAIKQDKYNPKRHPFLGFEFMKVKVAPKCINPEELELIKLLVKTSPNYKTSQKFMFQYYSFGMRVSDLLLIKWSDIKETGKRLQYEMYKTKQNMDIYLNNNLLDILYEFMPDEIKDEVLFIYKLPWRKKKQIIFFDKYKETNGHDIKFRYPDMYDKINNGEIHSHEKYSLIRQYLQYLSIDKDYSDKKIFSIIESNLDIKTTYSKVSTYTSVYNKDLKTLSDEIAVNYGKDLNLSSHMARHTFAYISLLTGQSIYFISKALNHKSIKTTEIYLAGFNNRQLDNQFYKKEISVEDYKAINDKLDELLLNADYEMKKKIIDMFS